MFRLAYCDKIADTIRKSLLKYDPDGILNGVVGPIKSDLDPVGGWFVSPKKAITLHDSNGKAYVVTIEEAPLLDIDMKKEVDTLAE
tara:strand:- start:371 stop:628 length:258 start_codon:yes stop_codon:yes gene_type:complete